MIALSGAKSKGLEDRIMSQSDLLVGIDVAKDELIIHLHLTGMLSRVANSKTGLAVSSPRSRKALALRIAKAIAAAIAASTDLAAREALLRTAPGVGPIVAACLFGAHAQTPPPLQSAGCSPCRSGAVRSAKRQDQPAWT
jgi:hypothetical protein